METKFTLLCERDIKQSNDQCKSSTENFITSYPAVSHQGCDSFAKKNAFQWDAYHPHVVILGITLADTPLEKDPPGQRPPGQRPPGQRPPWTETPLDRDSPGQRPHWTETPWTKTPLDRDPPDRDSLERDTQTETSLDRDPHWTQNPRKKTPLDGDPPLWTEWHTGVKILPSCYFVEGDNNNQRLRFLYHN